MTRQIAFVSGNDTNGYLLYHAAGSFNAREPRIWTRLIVSRTANVRHVLRSYNCPYNVADVDSNMHHMLRNATTVVTGPPEDAPDLEHIAVRIANARGIRVVRSPTALTAPPPRYPQLDQWVADLGLKNARARVRELHRLSPSARTLMVTIPGAGTRHLHAWEVLRMVDHLLPFFGTILIHADHPVTNPFLDADIRWFVERWRQRGICIRTDLSPSVMIAASDVLFTDARHDAAPFAVGYGIPLLVHAGPHALHEPVVPDSSIRNRAIGMIPGIALPMERPDETMSLIRDALSPGLQNVRRAVAHAQNLLRTPVPAPPLVDLIMRP